MNREDTVYVAIAPPKTLDADLVKRVASLVGKDNFDTRLLLLGEIPRIVAQYPDADTANSIALRARDAGLVAFVCKDSELRNRSAGFVAHTAKPGEREVIFWDKRGGEARLEAADAFLIIRGRKQSYTQDETSTTKMKLSLPATVLLGGMPVMRRVTQKVTKKLLRTEDFLRVYDKISPDPRVEMFQNGLDYSFLGPELAPSAPANFKTVVTKLREWFPQAIFDERLTRSFKTDVPAAGPEEALEINCKLVYLYYLTQA